MNFDKHVKAMSHARFIADTYSKDRSSKIGALILGTNGEPLSWGYNGFPRGVDDSVDERYERPLKYLWTEHAERNAIYNAARSGHRLLGASMYVTTLCPCPDCARGTAQTGISTLYLESCAFDGSNPRATAWLDNWPVSKQLLTEAGVQILVMCHDGQIHKEQSNLV